METVKKIDPALSILIVEDEKMAHFAMKLIINCKFPGVVVNIAENGKEGLELFKKHLPAIVITDINMPEMGGYQMASAIKAIKNDTKFIVITGDSGQEQSHTFGKIDVTAFIVKPVELVALVKAIERCVQVI